MLNEVKLEELKIDVLNEIGHDWFLITARKKDGSVNTMTASWGSFGILWNKKIFTIYVRPERYTYSFLEEAETFSISFFEEKYHEILYFLGNNSGRDVNKLKESGFHLEFSDLTPYFIEAKKVIFCKKIYKDDFKSDSFIDKDPLNNIYVKGNAKFHSFFIGEITKFMEH